MATVRDVCTQALQDLMVLGANETMSATDGAFALSKLNTLLDQCTSESLMLYSEVRTTWTIIANDGSYTVGSGGNVNVARPTYVDFVNYIDTSQDPDLEIPLIPLTDQAYAAIQIKALTSKLPNYYYYNLTYPLATLELYPIPTSTTLQGAMYARAQVGEFASLDTSVSLPPGWRRFLITNLALEMAAAFEREPSEVLVRNAMNAKATLKRSNLRKVDAVLDGGALIGSNRGSSTWYDFLSGNF